MTKLMAMPVTLAPTQALRSKVVDAAGCDELLLQDLFALFSRYYADVDLARFSADLRAKDFILLLEHSGRVVGFTTARLFPFDWRGETISVLFSGDTIVDHAFWGEQELAQAWLTQVGRLARSAPGRRMVWLLIAKGHRTYRYLPVFARHYVPRPGQPEASELTRLRDAIATAMFGEQFDRNSGVIRFAEPQGRLAGPWVEPTARELRIPAVAEFMAANPGFRRGDELACLCELGPENMRERARRWYQDGHDGG